MKRGNTYKMKTVVSVVVPVYNIPNDFLRQCLISLANQTLEDLEFIIVDDGSPLDGNASICDEFARKDNRFEVIHKKNEGVSIARNVGMSQSRGNWVAFVDPDDWVSAEMFELMFAKAKSSDADITVCDCFVESERDTLTNAFFKHSEDPFSWDSDTKETTLLQILGRNRYYNPPEIAIGVPWGKLYKRSFIESKGLLFEPQLRRMQDNIFNLYAFGAADSVAYVSKPMYHYRKFDQSTSNRFSPRVIEDFEKVFAYTRMFLDSYPHDNVLEQGYYSRIVQSFHSFFRFYFFNPANTQSRQQKRREIRAILSKQPFNEALHKLKIRSADKSVALFAVLLRMRCFALLGWVVWQREKRR